MLCTGHRRRNLRGGSFWETSGRIGFWFHCSRFRTFPCADSDCRTYRSSPRLHQTLGRTRGGVCGQRYVRWERYMSGYYRAYFFNIYSTGLSILIAIHSWKLRMCRHWARTLGRALKMRFRNRKRKAWLGRWPPYRGFENPNIRAILTLNLLPNSYCSYS